MRTNASAFRGFWRWVGWAGLVCLLSLSGLRAEPASATRKNVLFIISDDLANLLGCYGDPQAKTPNIDRLAARGARFDRAYCTYPYCGPSRNSLLTGLYPNSTGIFKNGQIFRQTVPTRISLPQAFRQQGYFVGRIGKLYHYNVPVSIGTDGHDDPASWELALNPAGVDRTEENGRIVSVAPGSTVSWYASPKGDAVHTDGKVAAEAEWVLERCAKQTDRPFFLSVGFFRPHRPYIAPRDPYFGYYPKSQMRVMRGVKEDQADIPPAALSSFGPRLQAAMTDDLQQEALQAYYASISFMDAQVGRVVAALDRLGLANSTVIVFTSDHGYMTGQHGLWEKSNLFEETARVPLLIVAPGVSQKGTVPQSPVSLLDLFPTLAGLCGLTPPAGLQGQSLVPLLQDPSAAGRGWALTQMVRNASGEGGKRFSGYSLRTERWRYTEWDDGTQGRELYDHDVDAGELTNLADAPAQAKVVAELSRQLHAAVKNTLPSSGVVPAVKEGLWLPTFMAP